ncbi:MAG: CHASE2 domain-containing protein [Dehalococcoidia bacterium]
MNARASSLVAALRGHSRREARRRAAALLVLLVTVAVSLFVWGVEPFQGWEWSLSDRLFRDQDGSPNIVVAGIDEETLAAYGRLGDWPRSLHAAAFDHLREAGAKGVAMDILFVEESEEDEELARALSQLPVILATAPLNRLESDREVPVFETVLEPPPSLQTAAAGLAHAHFSEDGDGVARRVSLAIRDAEGREYPALSLAALYLFFSRLPPAEIPLAGGNLDVLGRDVPLGGDASMRINFVGSADRFTLVSYGQVISGQFDPAAVRNKVVLVGETASGTGDRHRTPVSSTPLPGLYLHANALDTLLRARFLQEVGRTGTLLSMLALGAIAALALPRLSLRWGLVVTLALAAAYALSVWTAFDRGWVLAMLNPLILIGLAFVVNLSHRVASEAIARREVRDLFGRYISPEVAAELVERADRGDLRLGGELRQITALFADLRGFTSLSERRPAPEVVDYLNRCFEIIIGQVVAHRGMVNKFGGDAIVALWNAPQECPDHAFQACQAALASVEQLNDVSEPDPSQPGARFGFGINTGEALVGNVGSLGRLEYTAVGDSVNLAARICSQAPGGEVWIGPTTHELLAGRLSVDDLGSFSLKGKEEPVPLFRLRPDAS